MAVNDFLDKGVGGAQLPRKRWVAHCACCRRCHCWAGQEWPAVELHLRPPQLQGVARTLPRCMWSFLPLLLLLLYPQAGPQGQGEGQAHAGAEHARAVEERGGQPGAGSVFMHWEVACLHSGVGVPCRKGACHRVSQTGLQTDLRLLPGLLQAEMVLRQQYD